MAEKNAKNKSANKDKDKDKDLPHVSSEYIHLAEDEKPDDEDDNVVNEDEETEIGLVGTRDESQYSVRVIDSMEEARHDQDYDHHVVHLSGSKNDQSVHDAMSRVSALSMKRKQEERVSLEGWWVNSPTWRRTVPLMCITMLVMSLVNAIAAIYSFTAENTEAKDFDVCKTPGCIDLSEWILQGLDRTVDPCEDFYKFVCNKYNNPAENPNSVPGRIDFTAAKLEFNARSVLSDALKPEHDNKNIIIPFYKSCIDKRKRDVTDLDKLAEIINLTMPYLFTDIRNFDKEEGSKNLAIAIGHNGFFQYQFLEFPQVALLPPPKWLSDFGDNLNSKSTPNSLANFQNELLKTYRKVWGILKNNTTKPLLDVNAAVNYTSQILQLLSPVKFNNRSADVHSTEEVKLMLTTLFGEKWIPTLIDVDGKRFTVADIEDITARIHIKFRPEEQRPALLSFWIFCTLEFYAEEMVIPAYQALNLENVFTHNRRHRELQEVSIERYCFDNAAEFLNGYVFHQLQHTIGKNTDMLVEKMGEAFLESRRALRDIYHAETVAFYITPLEHFVVSNFNNPRNMINLNFPFSFDEATTAFIDELESYYLGLKVGPDYMINLWNASVHKHRGELMAWQDRRNEHRIHQNFEVESVESEIDNDIAYQNNMYPPISLFDSPLFLNDMRLFKNVTISAQNLDLVMFNLNLSFCETRLFDYAGAVLFLTRSFLDLADKNIRNMSPLIPLFSSLDISLESQQGHPVTDIDEEKIKVLTNVFDFRCRFENQSILRFDFFQHVASSDALSFIIAFRLFRDPLRYLSVRHKENESIATGVEYLFYNNGSFDLVKINRENNPPIYEYLDKADYVKVEPDRFKFKFRKVPNGLEDFKDDQLFFVASIRHQCHMLSDTNRSRQYVASVNSVLQQVDEFREAWDCPIGSPMNPPNKCIQELHEEK